MSDDTAARLRAFLEKAKAKHKASPEPAPSPFPGEDVVVVELVRSFLHWEVGAGAAERALASIKRHAVDLNELRVFLPDEIAAMLGEDDPRAQERAERLRACLNDIYMREHDVRLAHLLEEGKRDTRQYLDTLDGMHPFVSSRIILLCLGGHAFPVDTRLRDALAKGKVVPADQPPHEAGAWIERQVRAGEAAGAYAALEALVESQTAKSTPGRGGSKAASGAGAGTGTRRAGAGAAARAGGAPRAKKTGEARSKSKRASSEG